MPDFFFFGLQIFINFNMNFMGLDIDYRFDFHIYPVTCRLCDSRHV